MLYVEYYGYFLDCYEEQRLLLCGGELFGNGPGGWGSWRLRLFMFGLGLLENFIVLLFL